MAQLQCLRLRDTIPEDTKVPNQGSELVTCCASNIASLPLDLHWRNALPHPTDFGLGHETCFGQ